MRIISTNIGTSTKIIWNGKEEETGIYKYPVREPLSLTLNDVKRDTIIDRVHHGGKNKACYLFAKEQYPYWKQLYPDLKWDWGMFGENLTVEGLNETKIRIGDIFRMGSAVVQVSQPREPCYKLGVRFGTQKILKRYIAHGFPGTYVRVLEEGKVQTGDSLELTEQSKNSLTVYQFFRLLYDKDKDADLLQLFMENESVPEYKKEKMRKFL